MDRSQDEQRQLVPDTCNCGRGKLHRGFTRHIVKVGNEVVVIKDIPAWLCDLCDEVYITPDISEKIDEIMRAFSPHPAGRA
jgi:YgiT-type zinc finger domain-containing protein